MPLSNCAPSVHGEPWRGERVSEGRVPQCVARAWTIATPRFGRRRSIAAALIATSACATDGVVSPLPPEVHRAGLDSLVAEMRDGAMGDIRSFLLLVGDHAPVEYYFRGAKRSDAAPVYSVSKSITSLLTGLALETRALDSLRAPIRPILRAHDSLFAANAMRARITVEDLLTMRAGIAWDELSTNYTDPTNPVGLMLATGDWIGYLLSQPMAAIPGTRYAYNTGATIVLGEVVGLALRRPIASFAQERLFGPLGIPSPTWHHAANGVANAGGGLSLRPLDLLRIGQLVRDGGRYGGKQVVPAAWITASLTPHVGTTAVRYGYQWWMWGARGAWDPADPVYVASGWGGQTILIFPSRAAVIVVTALNFDRNPVMAAQALTQRLDGILTKVPNPQAQ
ncbi:MAG: serine hydrolase [Gemmatimonadetes bacterium]|nr:serine hydrolase [Gemmatimonadota bacterium]